jgi:DNA-binding beta-propeller fold protein YncE
MRRIAAIVVVVLLAACSSSTKHATLPNASTAPSTTRATTPTTPSTAKRARSHTPIDIYAADRPNNLSPVARRAKPLIYVPNSMSNTVDVIDPSTGRIVEHFAVGTLPQHVVPAWDMKTLYVTNDRGNSLTPIDPVTGKPGRDIPVEDPYNMYFTPDGKHAIVVAERLHHLDFRDPHTFAMQKSLDVPCVGVDHMDFSADGSYLIASCEFSGQLLKVDLKTESVAAVMALNGGASAPQDVKLSPNGRVFYVADKHRGGVYTIDGKTFTATGFIPTGRDAHGLYVTRDSKYLIVTNRGAGTISLIDFATNTIAKTLNIPGGSPDMGGLSADGNVLWVSGRYSGVVYAIDIHTGALLHEIPVGVSPHGLCVFPQPGRYSLGHTGVFR